MNAGPRFAWGASLPVIDGARVQLRPLRDADVPALFEIFGDEQVMRYWSSIALKDIAGARALLDDIRAHFAART